ncbi:MAG TPA: hypothetical protein VGK48_01275 [Terriglobia bacterium]|jgi:hypothetical protein
MTPEEIHNTIEFLIQHSANFSVHMEELRLRLEELGNRQQDFARRQERDHEFLMEVTKSTAQFQSWAADVFAIESRRLDERDQLHQDARAFQKEALRLLNRILDKLPPAEH